MKNNEMMFWDIFSDEYCKNRLAWEHSSNNPFIPAEGSSWKKYRTAKSDCIEYKGKKLFYYKGNGVTGENNIF